MLREFYTDACEEKEDGAETRGVMFHDDCEQSEMRVNSRSLEIVQKKNATLN